MLVLFVATTGSVATTDNVATTAGITTIAVATVLNKSIINVIQVPGEGKTKLPEYTPVVDIAHKRFKERPTTFKIFKRVVSGNRPKQVEIPPTASTLVKQFWPLPLAQQIVSSSNQYRLMSILQHPDLYVWRRKPSGVPSQCLVYIISLLFSINLELFNCHQKGVIGTNIHTCHIILLLMSLG